MNTEAQSELTHLRNLPPIHVIDDIIECIMTMAFLHFLGAVGRSIHATPHPLRRLTIQSPSAKAVVQGVL